MARSDLGGDDPVTHPLQGLIVLARFLPHPGQRRLDGEERLKDPWCTHHRYRGIEGRAWPPGFRVEDPRWKGGPAPLTELEAVLEYYENAGSTRPCDLIHVREVGRTDGSEPSPLWGRHLGFDVGFWEGGNVAFSYIFDGILGHSRELRHLASSLNEQLLLPSSARAWQVAAEVERLVAIGEDILESAIPDSGVTVFAISSALPWPGAPRDCTWAVGDAP